MTAANLLRKEQKLIDRVREQMPSRYDELLGRVIAAYVPRRPPSRPYLLGEFTDQVCRVAAREAVALHLWAEGLCK